MIAIGNFVKYEIILWFRKKEYVFWSFIWPILWISFIKFIFPDLPGWSSQETLQYYYPSAVTMILLSAALTSLSMSIAINKENKILKQLKIIPFSIKDFFISKMLVSFIFVLISIGVLTIFSSIYGLCLNFLNGLFFLIVLVGFLALASIAFFIAGYCKGVSTTSVVTLTTMMIFMFLSSVFFDLSASPKVIQVIAGIFPSSIICDTLRGLFAESMQIADILIKFLLLIIWSGVFLILSQITFKYSEEER